MTEPGTRPTAWMHMPKSEYDALAAENQKLREALRMVRGSLICSCTLRPHASTCAVALVDSALASAAPLLEGEGASK